MKFFKLVCALCVAMPCFSQTSTNINIIDSNGTTATARISNGNLYFNDSNGHTSTGTIRQGNVFITSDKGEVTFGTIRNGNVFLTDSAGTTTGTIRNGNIFLSGSDGSITTGSYNRFGSTTTTVSPAVPSVDAQSQRDYNRKLDQENYEAGYQLGQAVGSVVSSAVANHQIKSFCNQNPTARYLGSDGIITLCPQASLDGWEQNQIDSYCREHPGSWEEIGMHRENCLTPPDPLNLKWAKWELETWRYAHELAAKGKGYNSLEGSRKSWESWKVAYCNLAPPNSKYRTLEGKKEVCNTSIAIVGSH